jgi:hypothetical protein
MDFGLTTFFECPLKRFSASRAFIGFDFARRHQPPNRSPPGLGADSGTGRAGLLTKRVFRQK